MAGRWSVAVDGPEERLRGLSFVAEGARLADSIREAIGGGGTAWSDGGAAQSDGAATPRCRSPPAPRRATSTCASTAGGTILVVYEQRPGEPKTLAAVACPHCWRIGHVEIDAWAAAGGEYRAEKG